jgi:subtilisin family serine protease
VNGNVASLRSERFSALNGDARIYLEVAPGAADRVTPGTWQVVIDTVAATDGRFDAWIERDHQASTNQSFFLGADFDESMTISTPGTGRRSIAVANYDHETVSLHAASGRGRTRDGRDKPEVAAPGTLIASAHALGGRAGPDGKPFPMRVAFTGTSMSCPHVAGIVALLLQRRPDLTAAQVRKILIASASGTGPSDFDTGWGYGRVDAVRAVELAG